MLPPGTRLLVVMLLLGTGLYVLLMGHWAGLLFIAGALLLAWGYMRRSPVHAAFAAFKRGESERAEALLAGIPDPSRLAAQDRAYYHWLRGLLLGNREELEASREQLEEAARGRLRTENDRCLIHCHLAHLTLQTGDRKAAEHHLEQARKLPHKPAVDGLIRQLETEMDAPA